MAEFDPERVMRVWDWYVRDALVALTEKRRREALEDYKFQMELYVAAGGGPKRPTMPKILKQPRRV